MIQKNILKEIIISQRESLEKLDLGTSREKKVEIMDSFALIITGIRRCGKSTLMHQMMKKEKKTYYLNLEDPRLDGFVVSDFNKMEIAMEEIYGKDGIYFLDEIQNIEKWERSE